MKCYNDTLCHYTIHKTDHNMVKLVFYNFSNAKIASWVKMGTYVTLTHQHSVGLHTTPISLLLLPKEAYLIAHTFWEMSPFDYKLYFADCVIAL